MSKAADKSLDETKRLMGALVRMKPKPHQEMKIGKKKKASKPKKQKSAKASFSPPVTSTLPAR